MFDLTDVRERESDTEAIYSQVNIAILHNVQVLLHNRYVICVAFVALKWVTSLNWNGIVESFPYQIDILYCIYVCNSTFDVL